MGKPMFHAENTARRFGGKAEDYLDIHEFLDSSRAAFPDLRHRALTHNSWFLTEVLPRVFGETRKNSENKSYSVREVGEHHVLEDFANQYIPSAQDYLVQIDFQDWMDNGRGTPPSNVGIKKWKSSGQSLVSRLRGMLRKKNEADASNKPRQESTFDFSPSLEKHDCGGQGMLD